MSTKTALITGITSQDGLYLAKLLLEKGYKVVGLLRSNANSNLINFKKIGIYDDIKFEICDLLDGISLSKIISEYEFDEIYNLAAQSSVSESFRKPLTTIHFNSISVVNLLEIIRLNSPHSRFFQPCSSEMYGGTIQMPISEISPIEPTSPYAISKALAFWAVRNYRQAYNIFASNGVLFNHESFYRSDYFFIKKVIVESIAIKKKLKSELRVGNIEIRRDFGFAPDYVKAMWMILQHHEVDDFVICGGQSYLLRDIIEYIFDKLTISLSKLIIDPQLYRPVEIQNIYGDNSKIKTVLGWEYYRNFFEVIDLLIEEELNAN